MAIQQFYTPPPKKKLIPPKTNFWLRPWVLQCRLVTGCAVCYVLTFMISLAFLQFAVSCLTNNLNKCIWELFNCVTLQLSDKEGQWHLIGCIISRAVSLRTWLLVYFQLLQCCCCTGWAKTKRISSIFHNFITSNIDHTTLSCEILVC